MKRTTLKTRLWALAATLLLLVSLLAMPVSAAINTTASNGKITFQKHLVMDKEANVPNVTFEFAIKAGDAASYENQGKANTAVYKGITVENPPVIYAGDTKPNDATEYGKVKFAAGDGTTDIDPVDPETEATQKKASKKLTVDFTGVTFPAPGIYRYIITEKNGGSSGITYDTSRTLDVYVQYKKNTVTGEGQPEYTDELEVAYYVLQAGEVGNPDTATDAENGTKSDGFTNTYTTQNLTLKKEVEGNQGDRDKFFKFTVEISNAVPGTVYDVVIPTNDTPQQDDLEQGDNLSSVNSNRLTVGAAESPSTTGSVTGTYYLKSGQSIVIQGLTKDTKYTIEEKSYSTDGYSTAYSVEVGGKEVVQSTTSNSTGDRKMSIDATEPDGTATIGDNTVTFTNSKSGTVPTGILLETAPYLILGAVVVAGLVVLFATRRRRSRE